MLNQQVKVSTNPENTKITLYGHSFCPMVPPTFALLKRVHANFVYVDVMKDEAAMELLIDINEGYASVPTLVFPDGSTLTEPNMWELKAKLETLGYEIPLPRWAQAVVTWFNKAWRS